MLPRPALSNKTVVQPPRPLCICCYGLSSHPACSTLSLSSTKVCCPTAYSPGGDSPSPSHPCLHHSHPALSTRSALLFFQAQDSSQHPERKRLEGRGFCDSGPRSAGDCAAGQEGLMGMRGACKLEKGKRPRMKEKRGEQEEEEEAREAAEHGRHGRTGRTRT